MTKDIADHLPELLQVSRQWQRRDRDPDVMKAHRRALAAVSLAVAGDPDELADDITAAICEAAELAVEMRRRAERARTVSKIRFLKPTTALRHAVCGLTRALRAAARRVEGTDKMT